VVLRRTTSTSTTATGHGRAGEVVWRLAGVLASVSARGESEGRTESTGRAGALACPETCPCALWHGLGVAGTSRSESCRALLGQWGAPACSARCRLPPGHGVVERRGQVRGLAWWSGMRMTRAGFGQCGTGNSEARAW
jgi:hypothetical protein